MEVPGRRRAPAARWPRWRRRPDADVVFFAHHGFPDSMGQAWRELPHPTPITSSCGWSARTNWPEGQGRADRLAVRLVEDARRVGRRKIFAASDEFPRGVGVYTGETCSPHATIAQETAEIAMATPRPPLGMRASTRGSRHSRLEPPRRCAARAKVVGERSTRSFRGVQRTRMGTPSACRRTSSA